MSSIPPRPSTLSSARQSALQFDPQSQPVVPSQPLAALKPGSMSLDFIAAAFNRSVSWEVEPLFRASFKRPGMVPEGMRRAAVFMPLVVRGEQLNVLFTRRAAHLYDHAGQICFPGGRIEASDKDAVAAALRETHEEIGVAPEYIRLFGTQPGYVTTTRFAMTPVIGQLKPGFTVTPDASEVAEVFEVPLSVLMDPQQHRLHHVSSASEPGHYYFSISWNSYFIWGATAAVIRNFYHYLAAAQAQVVQPEQILSGDRAGVDERGQPFQDR